jgi:uncharacterized lipoprotein YddW (UPF0748 family)
MSWRNRCRTALLCMIAGLTAWAVAPSIAQTIILDNTDPGFAVLSQSWLTTSASGQYGADYRYRSTTQAPGEVEWRPDLPAAGPYAVDVWYRSAVDRPSNARYTVDHAGGSSDIYVDQRYNGSQWVSLGEFVLASGTANRVVLTSLAESGKTIVADAVRFRSLAAPTAVPALRACWLSHYTYLNRSETQLRQMAQNMRAGNINTVYFAVYSGQTVWWPSRAYKAAGGSWGSNSIDYCALLTRVFREEGLKVGAWFEYGLALGFANHPIAVAHPDWLARDSAGDPVTGENGGFVFISPGHPTGTQLIVDMARELAEDYGFDDIQLDRFRWGRKSTGREYGYEQVTRDLYFATYGQYPPTNVNNTQWVRFREVLVNDVVERAYAAIKAAHPNIVVSSAPTGYYGITQHMQRWSDWVRGGYIDLVMPQMYKTSLSTFQTEFNLHQAEMPAEHADRLGVGYRAQEDADWALVADQIQYAQGRGVAHGCLWVYHQYTAQIAIQDEIDNLPRPGQPWELPAYNPFTSPRLVQLFVDDTDGPPRYSESGTWSVATHTRSFRFGSRLAIGDTGATASFASAIPKSGRYEVSVWYTAAANRNPAARYEVRHFHGATPVLVDQRSGDGQWVPLGEWVFEAGPLTPRVVLSVAGSSASEYTSSDAIKLRLIDFALGDSDGDGAITTADALALLDCDLTGPNGTTGDGCTVFEFDADGDLDLADFAEFQRRVVAP